MCNITFYAFIVYRMGRLCGGAHEISGIKAPIFLHGGWLEGSWGGWGGSWGGWVGLEVVGGWVGGVVVLWVPITSPHHGGHQMPPCYFLTIW